MWHYPINIIKNKLYEEAENYKKFFINNHRNNTLNWPIKIFIEIPLIISERKYHCTTPPVIKINKLINNIFGKEYNWNIFSLQNITKSIQYHPWSEIQDDILRIFYNYY